MSASPQPRTGAPAIVRTHTVVMGRQDFLSVLLRLIGTEIYKMTCRLMSKVLALFNILVLLITLLVSTAIAGFFQMGEAGAMGNSFTSFLEIPATLTTIGGMFMYAGLFSTVILAGTLVGEEYSVGTIRFVLTRGPSRTQFLLSKLGALLVSITISVVSLVLLGLLLRLAINLIGGQPISFLFFSGEWFLHACLYLLSLILGLFFYAALAICLATLGKATVAGVAGALIWWALESLLSGLIFLITPILPVGPTQEIISTLPNYFPGTNLNALLNNQAISITGSGASVIPDWRALLIVLVYTGICISVAWWETQRQDITQ